MAGEVLVWGLTFELTPTAKAGAVRPGGDDSTAGADPPYSACRSGSGVERGVRRHLGDTNLRALLESASCFLIVGMSAG